MSDTTGLRADAVFEGGGVKGIGLVGALSVMEEHGYTWRQVAGTSAGAIVASLVAAGYSAEELVGVMKELDYTKFRDKGMLDRLGAPGMAMSVLLEKGIYEGKFLEEWLTERLAAKNVHTFADLKSTDTDALYRHRLQVIAADVSSGRLVVLPEGLAHYDVDPDSFSVARAVRMSMSIPFYYEPVRLGDYLFVDGGLLSNFPVWLFDRQGDLSKPPRMPTFGFKLSEPDDGRPAKIGTVFSYIRQIIETSLEAHDRMHVEDLDFLRTIAIPSVGVAITDFDIGGARRDALYESGRLAAQRFLDSWEMSAYVAAARVPVSPEAKAKVERWKRRIKERSGRMVGTHVYL